MLSIADALARWITRGTLLRVRWDRLFDDLEAQLDGVDRAELDAEIADRIRRENALVRFADRLAEALDRPVDLTVDPVGSVAGTLLRVGRGWALIGLPAAAELLVASDAIVAVRGLPALRSAGDPAGGGIGARLDLGHALRAVARDRATVVVTTRDSGRWTGTIDRVGADFVDLAEHPVGELRRPTHVTGTRTVRLEAIATVRTG